MNERERADKLVRAIDETIKGTPTEPAHLEDEELSALLGVARKRLEAGSEAALSSLGHEGRIWQDLAERLQQKPELRQNIPPETDRDEAELREAVSARRQLSRQMAELADEHRDSVWDRIQQRITTDGGRKSFRALPRSPAPSRTRFTPRKGNDIDALLEMALSHASPLRGYAANGTREQRKLRERMQNDPARRQAEEQVSDLKKATKERRGKSGGTMALAVGLALLMFAPLPFTGFGGHPAVAAAERLGEFVGATEATDAPPAPGAGAVVEGQPATALEASGELGILLSAPEIALGMPLTSSWVFPTGLSSEGNGLFVAHYSNNTATLSMYQEAAGGANFAVPAGEPVIILANGTEATYYEGTWASDGESLVWQDIGTQSIVLERNGVRTTLRYGGPPIEPGVLAEAAAGIAP